MKQSTKLLKDFLEKINVRGVRVRNTYNMSNADMYDNIIYYNPKGESKELEKIVSDIYKDKNHDIKISQTTYAFFHELGHLLSKDEIDDLDEMMSEYDQIVTLICLTIKDEKEQMIAYRKVELEMLADEYAYKVYKQYENLAIKLDKKLKALR
jgi:pantothenate kinase